MLKILAKEFKHLAGLDDGNSSFYLQILSVTDAGCQHACVYR